MTNKVIQPQPTNGRGANVYLNTLTVGGPAVADQPITSGSINGAVCANTPDAANGVYGIKDVKTDADGKVYFYLPAPATEAIRLAANTTNYTHNYIPEAPYSATLSPLSVTFATFTAEQVGGESRTTDSTGIAITFSTPITRLSLLGVFFLDDTGAVTKATTYQDGSKGPITYTVNLKGVKAEGNVKVYVMSTDGSFWIDNNPQIVTVYKAR
jgi:hypothetical protein